MKREIHSFYKLGNIDFMLLVSEPNLRHNLHKILACATFYAVDFLASVWMPKSLEERRKLQWMAIVGCCARLFWYKFTCVATLFNVFFFVCLFSVCVVFAWQFRLNQAKVWFLNNSNITVCNSKKRFYLTLKKLLEFHSNG